MAQPRKWASFVGEEEKETVNALASESASRVDLNPWKSADQKFYVTVPVIVK